MINGLTFTLADSFVFCMLVIIAVSGIQWATHH